MRMCPLLFHRAVYQHLHVCRLIRRIHVGNMGKKSKRNSRKRKKSSIGNDDDENENDDEGMKKCPHISKAVKLVALQNKIPHTTLGQCLKCGKLDSSEGLGVCICLFCAHQGCDRNSEEKHSLSHSSSSPSHSIVVHLQNWVVWCYACDDEVPVEPESTLHNCIKLILKAMNLSPPPELETSLSSPNKAVSTDKSTKDNSKVNSQLRSRIKGLSNLGNTCFFNAVMQNLCQTELLHIAASCTTQEGFSQHLSSDNKDLPRLKVTIQEAPGSLTKALWKLLQDSRSSSDRTLNPRQLFGEICKTATRFKGFRQQDSQELLRYLFDSIRTEELKRVKAAVLKSFGVTGGADAKNLDDNKKAQIKEYGASAEAPLIDSVFAGRLVSIVTCHQCHQEFKVEETFLDLSLPLLSPPQESYNNRFDARGGKQSLKPPKTPKSESTSVEVSNKETEKDCKEKNPSKHQQKLARKAERKKGKKGKGHGKKGKAFQEANENKQDDEGEKGDSGEEGDELDQMNVSDMDEQEHKLNESVGQMGNDNATEASINSSGGPEVIPNNDVQLEGVVSNAQHSRAQSSEKDFDTSILDSNRVDYEEDDTVKRDGKERAGVLEDSLKCPGKTQVTLNEDAAKNLQTERNDCQQKVTNQGDCVTCEGDDKQYQPKLLIDDKELPSMDFSNCNKKIYADEMAELNSRNLQCADGGNTFLPTESSDCNLQNDLQVSHNEPEVKLANDGTQESVLSNIRAILEEIVSLALTSDKASTSTCVENPLEDHAVQDEEKGVLKNCSETFTATEGLPQLDEHPVTGIETFVETEGLPPGEFKTVSVDNSEQHCFNNNVGTRREENEQEYQGCCSDSTEENGTKEAMELAVTNRENCDECETDSGEESETGCRSRKSLTLQPAYHPSPGECSVMSCLSQFCASEMLDGNNKFACEECSKRAQRVKEGKGTSAAKDDNRDDDSGDSSSDDEPKGATASKPSTNKKKDSKHRTVYTVASKQMLISLAPPVLTLHLKRFQQARFTLRKLTKHVDFPLELNLAPFCSRSGKTRPDSEGQVLYSLYGIIQHSGNMNSGHYTACVKVREPPVKGLYDKITSISELTEFIKNMWTAEKTSAKHGNSRCRHEPAPDGQWFHVSDSSVVATAETKVLKSQAYMLFYGRLPLGSR